MNFAGDTMLIAVYEANQLHRDVFTFFLKRYLHKNRIHNKIIEYANSDAMISDFSDSIYLPDIICVDVDRIENKGALDVAEGMRERNYTGEIILMSSNLSHAVAGYEVDARAYLLKPYKYRKIESAMNRIMKRIEVGKYPIRTRSRVIRKPFYEIMYIESSNSKCLIHCKDETYCVYKKLSEIEQEISDSRFLRCHQSYLVNMDYIQEAGRDFILSTGDVVNIRQRESREIKQIYYDYATNI
jgi:DNA-binding LytR/AlgR family response regulator